MHEESNKVEDYITDNVSMNDMSEDQFQKVLDQLPTMSNNQMCQYMKLMSRHKPVNEEVKANRKVKARNKNKIARKSRKANRK